MEIAEKDNKPKNALIRSTPMKRWRNDPASVSEENKR